MRMPPSQMQNPARRFVEAISWEPSDFDRRADTFSVSFSVNGDFGRALARFYFPA